MISYFGGFDYRHKEGAEHRQKWIENTQTGALTSSRALLGSKSVCADSCTVANCLRNVDPILCLAYAYVRVCIIYESLSDFDDMKGDYALDVNSRIMCVQWS